MIRVSVHLMSAISRDRDTELARMDIINDESGSHIRRNYRGVSYIGRDTARLDKATVSKTGQVQNWESERFHVWNLVRAMLQAMGYTQGRAQHAQEPTYEDLKFRLDYMESKYGVVDWNAT